LAFMILGGMLIVVAAGLDVIFRERMVRLGHKRAMLQGGAFNFAEYHKVRINNGWAAWPVYLMWAPIASGIVLLIVGFFLRFGTNASRP
jgi:hypothetical protein